MKAKVKLRRVKFNERLTLFVNNETVWGEIWYPEECLTPFFLLFFFPQRENLKISLKPCTGWEIRNLPF